MTGTSTHRPAKQHRSRDTLERMLDATERQLASSGVTSLDLRAVCADAGLTTGAVYSRFGGRQELLDALFERFEDRARAASVQFVQRIEEGTYLRNPVALDDFIALLAHVYASSGAVIAALIEGSYRRPTLGRRAVDIMDEAAELLTTALTQQGAGVDRELTSAATRLAFAWFDQQLFLDRIGRRGAADGSTSTLRDAMHGVLGMSDGVGSAVPT